MVFWMFLAFFDIRGSGSPVAFHHVVIFSPSLGGSAGWVDANPGTDVNFRPELGGVFPTGWWFGTFSIFPYIGNNHPNWLIFFRGVQTTNQPISWVYSDSATPKIARDLIFYWGWDGWDMNKFEDHPTPNRPRRWKERNPCGRRLVKNGQWISQGTLKSWGR